MRARSVLFVPVLLLLPAGLGAQLSPDHHWTLAPEAVIDEIIGEASGETAWNAIMEMGGYNRDRLAEEFEGTFWEAQYVFNELTRYGLPQAEIVRFPGGQVWDGEVGELWEVAPGRNKLASFQDLRAMLASGSTSCDLTAPLVWVGGGSRAEIEAAGVEGKIVVTEGSMSGVHSVACQEFGAEGVVCIAAGRSYDDLQLPWSGVGGWRRQEGAVTKFGFWIPAREGVSLKRRLQAGQQITAHAEVVSHQRDYDLEDIVCVIPGTDPAAPEVILSAHLFEGYTKQGANDNLSGSAAILEIARTLHRLIEEQRIPRPRRTIRFLWGPEFSGTGPWVKANRALMANTLCNLNLDMVGEWLSLNQAFFCLMRTTYGNAHYVNDVVENYYRYVGETSRERIQGRSGFDKVPRRIVAPSGADEPFVYSIETHYGASDHEVFNDWSVQVPGVMMIAWPDRWYHTSGDRVDKSDPTQLKRVAVIGAASAWTIASAGDDLARRIAAEVASNAARRLGHQFMLGLEWLNHATAESLATDARRARSQVRGSMLAELATLESVLELATDLAGVREHVTSMQRSVEAVGAAPPTAPEAHPRATAHRLHLPQPRLGAAPPRRPPPGGRPRP
ncbi:MAG: M28 family peptidase, partial [Planctomycetes bacterium]|nr:M28 family peptidase [Planctomycetota bacterium]